MVTIRGIIPGEYIVNAHYYSAREWVGANRMLRTNTDPDMEYTNSRQINNKEKALTVKVELHKVTPYKILWVGEKTFNHKGQEETFVRFTVDPDGKLIGDFSYEEKNFVIPYNRVGGMAPDIIEDEPSGASAFEAGTEESRYSPERANRGL